MAVLQWYVNRHLHATRRIKRNGDFHQLCYVHSPYSTMWTDSGTCHQIESYARSYLTQSIKWMNGKAYTKVASPTILQILWKRRCWTTGRSWWEDEKYSIHCRTVINMYCVKCRRIRVIQQIRTPQFVAFLWWRQLHNLWSWNVEIPGFSHNLAVH